MAGHHSRQQTVKSSKSGSGSQSPDVANSSVPSQFLSPNAASSSTSSYTPLSSYNPIGAHDDVGLRLGKYYPSNWERLHGKAHQRRPSTSKPTAGVMRSESQVPMYYGDQGLARAGPEARRRLQQYQRDMIAQASIGARAVLVNNASTKTAAATSTHAGGSPTKGQLATAFLRTHKPLSPRLQPLGSPGPVTPMSLEGDSYMGLNPPMSGTATEPPAKDGGIGTAWHRKDACSPIQMTMSI